MSSPAILRPVEKTQLGALHELIVAIEHHDEQPFLTSVEEAGEMLTDSMNPAAENMRVLDLDGELIGWANVIHSPSGQKLERAVLYGGVHPDHKRKGFGTQLLRWQTERSIQRLAETPEHLEAIALVERYDWQTDKHALFEANGYEIARYFEELQRPLDGDLPAAVSADGITVLPWSNEHTEQARLVYNVAFLDHWGTTPRSEEAWRVDVIENFGRRLDLSFVAFDGAEMVGYCLNGHYPDDEQVTGRLDGWVDSIATLSSHRGRGIASSLITHSLEAFASAGLNSSMLGVDSDNPTGAYGIYERLGYRSLHKHMSYLRTIRRGTEPVRMF